MAKIIDQKGIIYPIPNKESILLGRSSRCDVVIPPKDSTYRSSSYKETNFNPYQTISRLHCNIYCDQNGEKPRWFIEDANSTAGTFVEGKRLRRGEIAFLRNGQRINLGMLEFTFLED